MRELKRSIARHLMRLHGIERINKKQYTVTDKNGKNTGKRTSYFALHWREYIDPTSPFNKRAVRQMKIARKRGKLFANGFHP